MPARMRLWWCACARSCSCGTVIVLVFVRNRARVKPCSYEAALIRSPVRPRLCWLEAVFVQNRVRMRPRSSEALFAQDRVGRRLWSRESVVVCSLKLWSAIPLPRIPQPRSIFCSRTQWRIASSCEHESEGESPRKLSKQATVATPHFGFTSPHADTRSGDANHALCCSSDGAFNSPTR